MKSLLSSSIARYRNREWERQLAELSDLVPGSPRRGCFVIPSSTSPQTILGVMVSVDSEGWDHVSVSTPNRCPTYEEMTFVARLFFKENEYAMQLHVPPSEHVNLHPYCLHWWRPTQKPIPVPPKELVGGGPL